MKTQTYAEKIIARAQNRGSTSTTARGAAKWLLAHAPVSARPVSPLTADQYRTHWLLDSARPGQTVDFPDGLKIHYSRHLFIDNTAEQNSIDALCTQNPRKKNIYHGNPVIAGGAVVQRWETIHYKGAYKGYTGSSLHCDYQSCLAISSSGRTAVQITGNVMVRRFRAPAGMIFAHDSNGVLVRRLSDGMDYHPTYADWRAKNFATVIRKTMATNYSVRLAAKRTEREIARNQKIFDREIKSTRVTLEDSRRAGNCIEGSLQFAESRLGLTRQQVLDGSYLFSVSAPRLMREKNERALAAVKIAWNRETTVSI